MAASCLHVGVIVGCGLQRLGHVGVQAVQTERGVASIALRRSVALCYKLGLAGTFILQPGSDLHCREHDALTPAR